MNVHWIAMNNRRITLRWSLLLDVPENAVEHVAARMRE